jgi:hypothetical protein
MPFEVDDNRERQDIYKVPVSVLAVAMSGKVIDYQMHFNVIAQLAEKEKRNPAFPDVQ